MTHRSWRALTGSAAVAALMLFSAPASAQYYGGYGYSPGYGAYGEPYEGVDREPDLSGYNYGYSPSTTGALGAGYGRDLESYYDEVEERADYYENYSDYYSDDDGWFDWF